MSIEAGKTAYLEVDQYSAEVIRKEADGKRSWYHRPAWEKVALLWGDCVFVRSIDNGVAECSAKGHRIKVPVSKLTDQGIFCMWQIDCGQGDAALLRFPDDKWALVDVGPPRGGLINSNSQRTAVDFIKWIAFQDCNWMFEDANASNPFHFDWMVITHPDEDHFGAGREMVNKLGDYWSFGTVYHCGLGRFTHAGKVKYEPPSGGQPGKAGRGQLGEVDGDSADKLFCTSLIDHFGDVARYMNPTANRDWILKSANYAKFLIGLREQRGQSVDKLKRLSHLSDGSAMGSGGVSVKVLGPVEDTFNGKPVLRYLDGNSKSDMGDPSLTRNGQSVALRFDFGDVRLMLTGDLNFKSMALIQKQWNASELKCDVAKACHHGSDDISWRFLRSMAPVATMFSSGDQESHVHPRALVLGISAALSPVMKKRTANSPQTGPNQVFRENEFDGFREEEVFAPLIYSTELSRSVKLRSDMKPYTRKKDANDEWEYTEVEDVYVKGRSKKDKHRRLDKLRIAEKVTYGLINVRTDGERVMMAVLEEGSDNPGFHTEVFRPKELVKVG